MNKCTKCGVSSIDKGTIIGNGGNYYRSEKFSAWKQPFTLIKQVAYVCLQCGYTELYTDVDRLRKKLENK